MTLTPKSRYFYALVLAKTDASSSSFRRCTDPSKFANNISHVVLRAMLLGMWSTRSCRLAHLAPVLVRQDGRMGLVFVGTLAALAIALSNHPILQHFGLGSLTLAIILGIVVGNTVYPYVDNATHLGVEFSRNRLLRAGIVLYGFRLTLQQIADIGWRGLIIDLTIVALCFGLALILGHLLGVDRETTILVGAGSSICGAAAVMAAEPIIGAPAHKVSVAVATVVLFGTLAMFIYPHLYTPLGLTQAGYGIYVGSTVHEVAQVVVAGRSAGAEAAGAAVIVKMLRVMLLAPFLLLLSFYMRRLGGSKSNRATSGGGGTNSVVVPWFALGFVLVTGLNSLDLLPTTWVTRLVLLDTWCLALAMVALGLRTQLSAIRRAGARPLLLAAGLFVFLLVGGFAINLTLQATFRLASAPALDRPQVNYHTTPPPLPT